MDLKDGAKAEIPLFEMVKASLVLTDELIEDAHSRGQATEYDEDDFDEIEDDETQDLKGADKASDDTEKGES